MDLVLLFFVVFYNVCFFTLQIQNDCPMKRLKILAVTAITALLLAGCNKEEQEIVPEELPVINVDTVTVKTLPPAGGPDSIDYEILNPAEDGQLTASSEVGWMTGFTCSDGNVRFNVRANDTEEAREGVVSLVYTYGGGKTVCSEVRVSQEIMRQGDVPVPVIAIITDGPLIFSADGGEYSLAYEVENPVDDGTVTMDVGDVDWITDTDCSADGVVSFKVAANGTAEERPVTITLVYAYGADGEVKDSIDALQSAQIPDPILELGELAEIPMDGGSVSLAYKITHPVDGGKLDAVSEAEWLTDFDCSGEDTIAFTALANDGKVRTAVVTVTYSYNGQEIEETLEVTQDGFDYMYDFEYIYGEYSAENNRYLIKVADGSFDEDGNTTANVRYYLDVYSTAPENPASPLPAAGAYNLSSGKEPMTLDVANTYPVISGMAPVLKDAVVTFSYDDGNVHIDGTMTENSGKMHHFTYTGFLSIEGDTGGDEPGPGEYLNIQAVSASGTYKSDRDGIMQVELEFSSLTPGFYEMGPGEKMIVTAYMPFDADGNIATGEYEVTSSPGDSYTIWAANPQGSVQGTYVEIFNAEGIVFYPDEYKMITGGVMTVSGSAGNYTVSCDFTSSDGMSVACEYTGAVDIADIPQPYSCLDGDYELSLDDAEVKVEYHGNTGFGKTQWNIIASPAGGNGDGFTVSSLFTDEAVFEDGIPSGTYTATADPFTEGGYNAGYAMLPYYVSGTNYYRYENGTTNNNAAAPAVSGDLKIINNGDDMYTMSFEFVDDRGYVWSGEWSGAVIAEDLD